MPAAPGGPPDDSGQRLALFAQQQAQLLQNFAGKPVLILAGILPGGARDVTISSCALSAAALKSDSMVNKLPQGRPGIFDSIKKQLGLNFAEISEGLKKCSYTPSQCSISDITGQGMPGGQSFVQVTSGGSGAPNDISVGV